MSAKGGFLSLPGEIKNEIYRLVLVTKPEINVYIPSKSERGIYYDSQAGERCYKSGPERSDPLTRALFLVCRQMHEEAAPIYYGKNTFRLRSRGDREIARWLHRIGPGNRPLIREMFVRFSWRALTEEMTGARICYSAVCEPESRTELRERIQESWAEEKAETDKAVQEFFAVLADGHGLKSLSLDLPNEHSYLQLIRRFHRVDGLQVDFSPMVKAPWFAREVAKLRGVENLRIGVPEELQAYKPKFQEKIEREGMSGVKLTFFVIKHGIMKSDPVTYETD